MSKKGRRPWTIRIDEETRSILDKAIETVIESEGFSGQSARRDAVRYIADFYIRGGPEKETPSVILDLERQVNCAYLRREGQIWVCDETVAESIKRESAVLGDIDEIVLAKCLAHKRNIKELSKQRL